MSGGDIQEWPKMFSINFELKWRTKQNRPEQMMRCIKQGGNINVHILYELFY